MIAVAERQAAPAKRRAPAASPLLQPGVAPERLPFLTFILDRAGAHFAETLRRMSATPVEFTVAEIATGHPADVVAAYGEGLIVAFLEAVEWKDRITVGFDRAFVATLAETLFGGDGSEPHAVEERPFSQIETRLAQVIADEATRALRAAFAPEKVTFRFEKIEPRIEFVVFDRKSPQALVAKFRFEALERGGEMFVLIPQPALKALRPAAEPTAADKQAAGDAQQWARKIESEIHRTHVEIRAVLEETGFTLADIAAMQVGEVLELQAEPDALVTLEANGQALFLCRLGQADGHYVVQVKEPVGEDKEFIHDVLRR